MVREAKYLRKSRLFVHLDDPDGGVDDFDWQLFTPAERVSLADSVGLAVIVTCADFNAGLKPSSQLSRGQFVLECREA